MAEKLKVLGDITVYAALVLAFIYLLGFFKHRKTYKVFTIYLVLIALIQYGAFYVGRGHLRENNLYFSHFYYLVQFVLLTVFYSRLLKRTWLYYILIGVLVYAAFGFISDPSSFYGFNATGMTLTHALIALYSILYLYKCISNNGEFVIASCGIFLYLLSSTLIFSARGLASGLDISDDSIVLISNMNKVLYLIMLALLLYEWIKNYSIFSSRNFKKWFQFFRPKRLVK